MIFFCLFVCIFSFQQASASRDNVPLEDKSKSSLFKLQLSKEALVHGEGREEQEDSLTEEDLKIIAKEQMETAASDTGTIARETKL